MLFGIWWVGNVYVVLFRMHEKKMGRVKMKCWGIHVCIYIENGRLLNGQGVSHVRILYICEVYLYFLKCSLNHNDNVSNKRRMCAILLF